MPGPESFAPSAVDSWLQGEMSDTDFRTTQEVPAVQDSGLMPGDRYDRIMGQIGQLRAAERHDEADELLARYGLPPFRD